MSYILAGAWCFKEGKLTDGELVTTKLVTNNLVTYNLVTDNLVTRQFGNLQFGNLQFGNLNIMTTPKHIDNLVTLVFKSTLKYVYQFELSSPFNQSVNASIAIFLCYFFLTSNTFSLVFFSTFLLNVIYNQNVINVFNQFSTA